MERRRFLREGARLITGAGLLATQAKAQTLPAPTTTKKKVILIWSEGTAPASVYPDDIRGAVARALRNLRGYEIRTATLSDPEQGASQIALDEADVLMWWGHQKHGQVTDATVERIVRRVQEGGMGFVALHSSHFAKPFKAVIGDTGAWKAYVNDGKPHHLHVTDPTHPIARGVRDFTIPREERYEEAFQVPTPEAVVFDALHESTQTRARQGLCWTQGKGRVFYFRPGHEEFPVYFQPEVTRILRNAALWAARDEAGIWEDNDPYARAARATKEPPLALICQRLGYGGTDITRAGELMVPRFVKAGPGSVETTPLAAFGLIKVCTAGWAKTSDGEKRTELWKVDAKNNKQDAPPLMQGAKTTFDPKGEPFTLWVKTDGFAGEYVSTDDAENAKIKRFGGKPIRKAHVYALVRSDNTPEPNAFLIGWEYSTNDDNQDIVTIVRNVRPA